MLTSGLIKGGMSNSLQSVSLSISRKDCKENRVSRPWGYLGVRVGWGEGQFIVRDPGRDGSER